jgi:glutamine synthetase
MSNIEEVMEFMEENDVKFIRLAFCDVFGEQKNISIMPQELERAFAIGIHFDSFLIQGFDDPQYPDLYLKPDLTTLSILPWRPQQGRVVRFYCDLITADGQPYPYDARYFLKETLKLCRQEYDFSVRIGLRSEFYLFKTDEEGKATREPWDQGGYLDIAPKDRGENIRREICLTLEEMGIQPETSHHESGPGQNEIDFRASDALSAADHFITYRNVVSTVAARNGVVASFEPKPLKNESGNGLHMNIATYRNGQNIDNVDRTFTEHFMAGVLHRMREITIFLNNRPESYDRFGAKEAPRYINWSTQNRSRLLRVPVNQGKRSGFILRSPDSGIDPYLAFAIVIRAGLEGLRNQEMLPEPLDRSMRHMSREEVKKFNRLPSNIDEAIACAKNSEFLQEGDCAQIANRFLSILEEQNRDNDVLY